MGNAGNEKMNTNNGNHAKAMMRHGSYGKRIIRIYRKGDREYQLHATKGWRNYRVTK
jgi:hypothetical protein